jgi:uncharacterized YigZ family protein
MKRYLVPAEEIRREQIVVNSRFIASLGPVFSVEEAKTFITRIKNEFPDASHNVPVYLIGHGNSEIAHCTDAGEPSGTAGRPALSVLRGSGLGDVAVVVTRYFGGTKLGTGGLVRAYSDAVRSVIEAVPRAEKVPTHTVMAEYAYRLVERVRQAVIAHHGQILDEEFTVNVTLTARFAVEDFPHFQSTLLELTNGSTQTEIIESGEILMPLKYPDK